MRSFFAAMGLGLVLAMSYAGCGLIVEGEYADTGGPSPTSGGSTTGGMDAGPPCMTPDQCGPDTDCSTWACTNGQCAITFKPDGTLVQTGAVAGDCQKNVCMGGNAVMLPDDDDFVPDNDPCLVESCAAGMLQKGPAPDGTPCGDTNSLSCVEGLCKGCKQNPANCPMPTACKKYDCPVDTCIEDILVGTVTDPTTPDDCKRVECDANGMEVTVGNPVEVPPQKGDDCKVEKCGMDGNVFQENANENVKCANPPDVCYNDSVCKSGTCTEQPKPSGAPAGSDGMAGNCKSLFCDGMGGTMPGNDDNDVLTDPNPNDCVVPSCMNGSQVNVNENAGSTCTAMGGDKCCGSTCCPDTGTGYCDKNNMCCMSGKTCGGTCCPNTDDNCNNNTCCSGSVCGGTCCPTDHACDGGMCCPMQQRCPNGTCCPTGQSCNNQNMCSM